MKSVLLALALCLSFGLTGTLARAASQQDIQQLSWNLPKPGEGWSPNAVQRYLASTSLELGNAAAMLTP